MARGDLSARRWRHKDVTKSNPRWAAKAQAYNALTMVTLSAQDIDAFGEAMAYVRRWYELKDGASEITDNIDALARGFNVQDLTLNSDQDYAFLNGIIDAAIVIARFQGDGVRQTRFRFLHMKLRLRRASPPSDSGAPGNAG